MSQYHTPVMLDEVLQFLNIQPNHWYLDCNLGGGGHTQVILKLGGQVVALDMDLEAIQEVADNHQLKLSTTDNITYASSANLILIKTNFAKITSVYHSLSSKLNLPKQFDGALFDLGLSSHQLDLRSRGFSFQDSAPLDMRMDAELGVTAADLLMALHEKELAMIFEKYGEESWSKPIAKAIVKTRMIQPITTTTQLADLVKKIKHTHDKIHPATQVFQALRIAVNDELHSLESALPQVFDLLAPGARLVVISFHSLEDRIVKHYFNQLTSNQPVLAEPLTDKPVIAKSAEIEQNPRSRSAKLRAIQKL